MLANKEAGVSTHVTSRFRKGFRRDAGASPVPDLDSAIDRTRHWLLTAQRDDGHWVGELEGDTILESEYILLMAFLGRGREAVCIKAAKYLDAKQCEGGGWANYPGGPADLSVSVKAYFALKLVGLDVDHPTMVRAREVILALGGAQACNSFTRFYLALLGQMSYDETPCVPPALVRLPHWVGFSLYQMSSWTRTIVVPLSIIASLKPVRPVPEALGIPELFRADLPRRPRRRTSRLVTWTNTFLLIDRALKGVDRVMPDWLRRRNVKAAERWVLEHLENSDGLGAIYPPMVYTIIMLEVLGYDRDSHLMQWAMRQLDDLIIEEDGAVRFQPCVSPVWDTAIAMIALADAGLPPSHPALRQGAQWLVDHEVKNPGDWHKRRPGPPAGWHFQYANEFYPDIDDTAMVLLALKRTAKGAPAEQQDAFRRGLAWLLSMQNRDGGWAAFDVDIDNEVLTRIPFADHNAMLDPSCADITARILELLGGQGYRADHPAVAHALEYLWATQEPEGCWYGRWGVNYIYGTWQVLLGLEAIGFPMDHPAVRRAVAWLESVQQADGGWGETCASYDDPTLKGQGEPTASQTAWAVLGLIAAGRADSDAVRRGIAFLTATQDADGAWDETPFTGTGFPRVFYLKYHLYRVYFPLMALARFREATALSQSTGGAAAAATGSYACRVPALPLAGEI
jgi:squalene-hopene/tetraprenyl-beta-curcumene cyclase